MSRGVRTALAGLLVGPVVGAAIAFALVLAGQGILGVGLGVFVSAAIGGVVARRSGYGDDGTLGWTLGSMLAALVVMAAVWAVFIALLVFACDDCIR